MESRERARYAGEWDFAGQEPMGRKARERRRKELRRIRRLKTLIGGTLALLTAVLVVRFGIRLASAAFSPEGGAGSVPTLTAAPGQSPQELLPEAGGVDLAVAEGLDFSQPCATEEEVLSRLEALRGMFPDGAYWNHAGREEWSWDTVTDTPCDHSAYGEDSCNAYNGATAELFPLYLPNTQCLGFASLLSDLLFGKDAPVTVHRSFDSLRVGDQIRLTSAEHSMLITGKDGYGVTVAECNADYNSCQIAWGRFLSREELEGYGEELEYITRWE